MLEHGLERPRIAAAQEAGRSATESRIRHVADAPDVEQRALERRQPAAALRRIVRARLPQPPRGVQRVEVRHAVERHLHAVEEPARLHHRHVERLAVVGDDQIGVVEELGDRGEQRALGRVAGQQELPDLKRAEVEVAAADEERHRAGAAAQAGRFEVDEDRAPRAARRRPADGSSSPRLPASPSSQSEIRTSPCQRSDS